MFQSVCSVHIVVVLATVLLGVLSCYALGDKLSEVIIYDLPNGVPYAIITQIFYMFNIMGTFVVMAMVIYQIVES